jgi:hypothetical protein
MNSTTTGYDGQLPIHIPEYATSTISKLEVDHRDKIAKINAEYNAVSPSNSSSSYSNNDAAVAIDSMIHLISTSPPNQPSPDTFTRAAFSQPLHPNLHFPTKPDPTPFGSGAGHLESRWDSSFRPHSCPSSRSSRPTTDN